MTSPFDRMGLTLRRGVVADAPVLAHFAEMQFVAAFGAQNDPGDLAHFLRMSYGIAQQQRELGDPDWVTLLLEREGAPCAYAQLSRTTVLPAPGRRAPVELRRFYVDRAWHGRGVAGTFMAEVLAAARALGGDAVVLGVWEANPRGIAFYRKAGFTEVGRVTFMLGRDAQTDHVMMRPLP